METNLLTDLLAQLKVPHTDGYTTEQLNAMPFQTLFGLKKLLEDYGVESAAWHFDDKSGLTQLTPPFIAVTKGGLVIVTDITGADVGYLTQGVAERMPTPDFLMGASGSVMTFEVRPGAREPEYGLHCREEFFMKSKKWVLLAGIVALFVYLFVSNGIYRHVSTVLLTLLDLAGLYATYLLVRKSLNIHDKSADRVCKVLQEGGCDHVLELKASKFFGLFGWSEVGFAYFTVSLGCLLIFPQWTNYLALCNVLCLPFTFWSIWYQKFRAKTWCTLCVTVQCILWLLFFCYLGGGWLRNLWPLKIEFFVLGVTYVVALLGYNRVLPYFNKSPKS